MESPDELVGGVVVAPDDSSSNIADIFDAAAILAQQEEALNEGEVVVMDEGTLNETVMLSDVADDSHHIEVPVVDQVVDSSHVLEFEEGVGGDSLMEGGMVDEQLITEEVLEEGHTDMMLAGEGELQETEQLEQNVIMMDSEEAILGNEEVVGEAGVPSDADEADIAAQLVANEVVVKEDSEATEASEQSDTESSSTSTHSSRKGSSDGKRRTTDDVTAANKHLCTFCPYEGDNSEEVDAHIAKMHPQTGVHRCSSCMFSSSYGYGLEIHSVLHDTSPPYQCTLCPFKCELEYQMNGHINYHTGEKQFRCNECDYGTDNSSNYRKHMGRHINDLSLNCTHCSYSCNHQKQLEKHLKTSHKNLPQGRTNSTSPHPVKVESAESLDLSAIEDRTSPNQDDVDMLSCSQCSFTTKYSSNMDKHMLLHASGSMEQISCDSCSYTTVSRSNLKRHQRSMHPELSDEKDSPKKLATTSKKSASQSPSGVSLKRDSQGLLLCEFCDYKTPWHTNLKRHSATHEPKVCSICSFTTNNRNLFIKHQKSHDAANSDSDADSVSSSQNIKEYACNVHACGFSTISERLWRLHQREHSEAGDCKVAPMEGSDDEDRATSPNTSSRSSTYQSRGVDKFHCTQCDFFCNHDTWLETHMKQHAVGKTSHKCQYCGYTAPNPHRLKAHMMTHTGYKPYKCPRCDFASSNSSNLYRHIRKKHDPEDVELAKNQKVDAAPPSSEDEDEESDGRRSGDDESCPPKIPLVIYRCNDCEFRTMSRESLTEHKEVHAATDDGEAADSDSATPTKSPTRNLQPESGAEKLSPEAESSPSGKSASTSPKPLNDRRGKLPVWKVKMMEEKARAEKQSTTRGGDNSSRTSRDKYTCTLCSYVHSYKSAITAHLNRAHFGEQPFRCRLCILRTHSMYHLNRHKWSRHRSWLSFHVPPRTDKNFQRKRLRWTKKLLVTFACNRCGLETNDQDEWGRHLNQHAKEQIKSLQEKSPKAASRKKEPTQISSVDNVFTCSECDFTCRRKDMYTAHVKQHSKKAVVSKCDQCPYTTSNPYNLMKHKRTHTGEKPFKCSYCAYRSADSGNLNKHINSHHGVEGVKKRTTAPMKKKVTKKLDGPAANTSVEAATKLVKVSTVASARLPTVKLNPDASAAQAAMLFKCTECDYKCGNEDFLIAHLSIHKKQGDQYVCAICDYASRNQQNLAKHIRTHTGEKPYQCNQCSYSAADKGNLNKHMKTHHRKDDPNKLGAPPAGGHNLNVPM